MSEKLKISERIWAKLNDHNGVLDDDFECIAHEAKALESENEALKKDIDTYCYQVGHVMYKVTERDNGQSIYGEHKCSRCGIMEPFQFDYNV